MFPSSFTSRSVSGTLFVFISFFLIFNASGVSSSIELHHVHTIQNNGDMKPDEFGQNISSDKSGQTLVVGGRGKAMVHKIGTGKTTAGNGQVLTSEENDYQFGSTVKISADGSFIGVFGDAEGNDSGSVSIFTENDQGIWVLQSKIRPPNTHATQKFGSSLDFSEDGLILAVGAAGDNSCDEDAVTEQATNDLCLNSGVVFLYGYEGDDWVYKSRVKAKDGISNSGFGTSIDLDASGDRLVVGAPNSTKGEVYLFARDDNGKWQQTSKLFIEGIEPGALFGQAVAFSNNGGQVAGSGSTLDLKCFC